jgi:hypothetical protein
MHYFNSEMWRNVKFSNFEICRSKEVSWTDRVGNEVLHRVQEERNILDAINRTTDNCIGLILLRNFLLKHVIEG